MRVRVHEIPPEGLRLELEEDGNLLFAGRGLRFGRALRCRLEVRRTGRSVTVEGSARTAVVLECSRCLEEFALEVLPRYSLECRPVSEISRGGEAELSADQLDVLYHPEGVIDLDEVVMGGVAEEIPLQPLCSEACRGLCPVCGGNRNREPCTCEPARGDPRFALLASLHKPNGSGSSPAGGRSAEP